MNFKYLLAFALVTLECASAGPILKELDPEGSWLDEIEPEEKAREKRKIDLLHHLETEGIGVKKAAAEEETVAQEGSKLEDIPAPQVPAADSSQEEGGTRTKKQTPNHVGNCGKTTCGPVVSARGPAVRMLLRGNPGVLYEGHGSEGSSKGDFRSSGLQARTFDSLLALNPLASAVSYAVPAVPAVSALPAATYSADAASTLGHALLKPTIAAPLPVAHIEPVSLNLFAHPLPLQPLHTMFSHHHPLLNLHRMEVPKIQEIVYAPTEVKQPPAYEVKPYIPARPEIPPFLYHSRYGSVGSGYDGPMICHPYDEKMSQQVIQIRPEVHVIEGSGHKNLNASAEDFKSQYSEDDEKVHDHLRQVSEIKEEITQLNRAAQKIVDQQERIAEMQQRHLWKSGGSVPYMEGNYSPYYANRMYTVPLSISKANALAYPTSTDDIEFFVNMLKAGKKIGTLSETLHPAFMSGLDAAKLILSAGESGQTSGTSAASSSGGKLASAETKKISGSKSDGNRGQ